MQGASKIHPRGWGRRAARRRGMTLIEAAIALALFALAAGYAVQQVADYLENVKARTTAEKMVEVSDAAKGYVKANYAALLNATPVNSVISIPAGRPSPTAAVPSGPAGLPSIQGGGYLSENFVDTNGFGQRHALLVKRTSTSRLEAIVTTYGGRTIPDGMLTTIGTYVGNTGGYVMQKPPVAADTNRIIGAYGGYRSTLNFWGSSAERPAVGRFQSSLAFEDGKLLTDYLYRNDIGIAEANRMNTAIDMNSQQINNIGRLTGVTDSDTNLNTVIAGDKNAPSNSGKTSLRATIDVWANRNVIADQDVNAGRDVNAVRDIHANRNIISEKDVVSYQDLDVYRNGRVRGNLNVNANLEVGGNATMKQNATVDGQADIATLDLSRTEVLIPGRFGASQNMKLADLLPKQVAHYSYVVTPTNRSVPKPDCAGGYSKARIMVFRQVDSTKGYPQVRLTTTSQNGYITSVAQDVPNSFVNVADGLVATNRSSYWDISWIGSNPADGATRQAIAQTYCYYG